MILKTESDESTLRPEYLTILQYINSIGGCEGLIYVGLNDGEELKFCKTFAKKIYGFEPIPDRLIWDRLEKYKSENVSLYNMALGNHSGYINLYPASNEFQSSSIFEPTQQCKNEFKLTFNEPIEVKIERLQSFNFFNDCNTIIIDVQGAELEVLNGIDNFSNIKLIILEYTSCCDLYHNGCTFDEIYKKLTSNGFHFCQTLDAYISPVSNLLHGNAIFRKL